MALESSQRKLAGIEELCPGIRSQPLHPSSASMSRSSSARLAKSIANSRGSPAPASQTSRASHTSMSRSSSARFARPTSESEGLSPCVISQPLHPSSASSSQAEVEQVGHGAANCRGTSPRQVSTRAPFGTDRDLLSWQSGTGVNPMRSQTSGVLEEDLGKPTWSKRPRKCRRHFKAASHAMSTADNSMYYKSDTDSSEDDHIKECMKDSYSGLAGLPSWLSRANKRVEQLKELKQKSIEAANLRAAMTDKDLVAPHRQGIQTNPQARLYQSSVGTLVFGASPNDVIDDSAYDGSAGKPTWASELPRNKKRPDYLQMEAIDVEHQPKPRGTRHYESQEKETASLLCDDGLVCRDELRTARAEKEFSKIHEGSAGCRTWFEPPQRITRDFSKAPNVKSMVDIVAFGRDVDFEGETPWSADFTELYDGLAGRPTWTREQLWDGQRSHPRRGLRHVDHPSNHWSGIYESDPWRGKIPKSPKRRAEIVVPEDGQAADLQQRIRNAPLGYAGLPSWEETQCTYHHGPRKILAPTALNETFYMEDGHAQRIPPKEWSSNAFAGMRSWEKRPREEMEIRADNVQKFGTWTDTRPAWRKARQARSNPPQQDKPSRRHNDYTKRPLVRNSSVSPRAARALAGG